MIPHIQVKNTDADAMRKVLINFFVLLLCAACTKQVDEYTGVFSDGLPIPDKTDFFDLSDGYGTKQIDTFYIDAKAVIAVLVKNTVKSAVDSDIEGTGCIVSCHNCIVGFVTVCRADNCKIRN